MGNPLIYILAPFGLAFALFVFYLVVSLFLRDPARPFRMFKAPEPGYRPESNLRQAQGGGVQRPEEEKGSSEEEKI